MRFTLNGKIVGLVLGLVSGLLFVFLGWKAFLILLAFILAGFVLGCWVDARGSVRRRLKSLTDRVLRS